MTTILRLESSIKGEAAVSRKLTDRIIARLTAAHPDATVITRDLSKGLSHINGAWLGAVYTPADARDSDQQTIAATADALLDEVKAADTLVIALPVYNFGIPAHLKAWIDNIARKGESFTYTENGPIGLLTGKRAFVAYTAAGTPMGSDLDHASGYLRHMLGFLGITDVTFVAADGLAMDREAGMARAQQALEQIAA